MALERKKTLNVFKEAAHAWGSHDDFPVGPKGTDPMPHLSRCRVPQPFYLIADEDQVLIQMAGRGTIELKGTEPSRITLAPGDTVYIPARVPSRLLPDGETLHVRLKAEPPPREAVAWYCEACGARVHATALPPGIAQAEYWRAVEAFNASESLRTCRCGVVHPAIDLGDIAWLEVAAALRAEEQS